MSLSPFNQENLDFRFVPKDAKITESMVNEYYSLIPNPKKQKALLLRHLSDGIRMDPDGKGYNCVMCCEVFDHFDQICVHVNQVHQEPVNVLRGTPCKPIVGLDLIIEYRNDKDEIAEYECTLCKLYFGKHNIFWHVVSIVHKEKFFQLKYPNDLINQMDNQELKHEKIDEVLINHEKSQSERGRFLYRRLEKGMIESASNAQSKLNMSYITKLYPTESSRLNQHLETRERWILPLRDVLSLKIENEEQFRRGKEILQRMNKALAEYVG